MAVQKIVTTETEWRGNVTSVVTRGSTTDFAVVITNQTGSALFAGSLNRQQISDIADTFNAALLDTAGGPP